MGNRSVVFHPGIFSTAHYMRSVLNRDGSIQMLVNGDGCTGQCVPPTARVPDLIIDQHFAQRARIERLVGAVAEDPGVLGIGIDGDTAVIHESGTLRIIGSGAVYVADGQGLTYTNVSERTSEQTLSLFDLRLHVLSHGSTFDLETRRPNAGEFGN